MRYIVFTFIEMVDFSGLAVVSPTVERFVFHVVTRSVASVDATLVLVEGIVDIVID